MNTKKLKVDLDAPMADFIITVKKEYGDCKIVNEYLALLNKCESLVEANKKMVEVNRDLKEKLNHDVDVIKAYKHLEQHTKDLKKAIHIITA